MGKKAASKAEVEELHKLLCDIFRDQLQGMKEGDIPIDYKLFGVISKFIADNDVSAWEDIQELESAISQIAKQKQAQRQNADNIVELKKRLSNIAVGQ